MDTMLIPLSKLRIDPANVRHPKDGDVAAQVHDMQASLLELGQLSALEVRPLRKPRGHYQVFAGGRRLLAFQGLAADGRIPADHPIRCDVHEIDDARASEISAAENLVRVDLKPTERFQLFADLLEKGVSEEDVARRFAIEVADVRRFQRLGRLHPTIFEALDAEKITLDVAKAYASTEDRALQKRVWDDLSAGYNHWPHNVRNAIRGGAAGVDQDRMLKVVGRQAYLDAGGQIEVDLFTDTVRVVHRGTLEELYYAEVERQQAALAATLPAEVTVVTSGTGVGAYVYASSIIPEDKRDRLTAIDERTEQIHDSLEQLAEPDPNAIDGDTPDEETPLKAVRPEDQQRVVELRAELDQLEAESEAIHNAAAPALPAGPIVAVAEAGPDGMTVKGYYRPAGWIDPEAGDAPARGYVAPEAAAKAEIGLTKDGFEVMRSHRRAVLRGAIVADNVDVGHRFLIFTLARLVLNHVSANARGYHHDYPSSLGVAGGLASTGDPFGANEVGEQEGAKGYAHRLTTFAARPWMLERDAGVAFKRFLDIGDDELEQVAAMLGASMLDRSLQSTGMKNGLHDALADAMQLDDRMIRSRYWTPDEAFFAWLPKGRRIDAVAEVSPRISKAIAKKPTADIAAACARFFRANEHDVREFGMVEAEERYARIWVPAYIRFTEADPPWIVAHANARAKEMAS